MTTEPNGVVVDHQQQQQLLFASTACACRPNTMEWCKTTSFIVFASQRTICIVSEQLPYHRIIETVERAHLAGEGGGGTIGNCKNKNEVSSLFCTAASSGELAIWKMFKTPTTTTTTIADGDCRHVMCIKRINKKASIELSKMAAYAGDTDDVLLAILQFDHIDVQFLNLDGNDDQIGATAAAAVSSLKFGSAIPSTFELSHICGAVVMAVGLSNGLIDIFVSETNSYSVQKKLSLDLCGSNKSWTRALAFNVGQDGQCHNVSLAAATDGLIKIWQFVVGGGDQLTVTPLANDVDDHQQLKMNQQTFCIENGVAHPISVTLESVLHAQTGPIYALAWHPNRLELLSSGANQTVVRWSYSDSDSIWLPISRFGDLVGDEVNCYDITFSPCGRYALCHSFLGGFHFWEIDSSKGVVLPKCFPISGHFAEVTDLCWSPDGSFLLSCSADMTTRIFAKHKQLDFFFELARPQTHGHPINCLTSVDRNLFVSGGEEKIFRVFQATSSFAQNLANLSDCSTKTDPMSGDECLSLRRLPIAAAFQTELTLTNTAVTEFDDGEGGNDGAGQGGQGDAFAPAKSLLFTEPPREDQLSKLTLFPEEHKLYGHGFEVFSCASSRNGRVLATCCKASHSEHAAILLWDTRNWKLMNTLKAHQLTVTRLSFSHDDQFLLSVSRDRNWALFRRPNDAPSPFAYTIFQVSAKGQGHSRIIWDCAWASDAHLFATCSRDKALKVWRICAAVEQHDEELEEVKQIASFVGPAPQTAVDIAPGKIQERLYLIAVGFENGAIVLLEFDPISKVLRMRFQSSHFHSGSISRLRFCSAIDKKKEKSDHFLLASASCCIVKIHRIEE
ncbi:hypothetical protein niasHT_027503 [Heterodera trifolii]|uniref:Elongator complex protein 2 n=1 Tax=Heterodera trifolii TaxID=157864 RepID=A0ABD2JN80_9BILA